MPLSSGDRHLEAAETRVVHHFAGLIEGHSLVATRDIVTAYLDSLLGELPPHVVTKASVALGPWADQNRDYSAADAALKAALRSLRDSLASGQGQGQRHEG